MWVGFQDDWGFRWSPDRTAVLDDAMRAGATIVRTTVYWSKVAPRRPANAADPFDPAYGLYDLDELVRGAQHRGMQVLLTIWGTPAWANGGAGENHAPTHVRDLRDFAHALAARYSGRYPGYAFVRFYSVWNEPNLEQFLAPQFDRKGASVSPRIYAAMFKAAAAGIRSANPYALVAAGETAHHGIDRPRRKSGFQASHSPARFAELVSQVRPQIRFDAWSHHPYPLNPKRAPKGQGVWPDVSMPQLEQFRASLERWFKHPGLPLWITEFGYQTTPGSANGVTPAAQARYLNWAFNAARADPNVKMFVWFVFRDRANVPWKGGLESDGGNRKAGFASFEIAAHTVDARNPVTYVRTDQPNPRVTVPVLQLGWYDAPGAEVGISYELLSARRLVVADQVGVRLGRDMTVRFRPRVWPAPGKHYLLRIRAQDVHGNTVYSRVKLVPIGKGGPPPWTPNKCVLGDSVFSTCP
jgi:hypothetical protein